VELLSALPEQLRSLATRAFDMFLEAVGRGIGLVLAAVLILPGRIIDFLRSLPERMGELASQAWARVTELFTRGVARVVESVQTLGPRIVSTLLSLPGRLSELFSSIWSNLVGQARGGGNQLVDFIRSIPGRILGLAGVFLSAAKSLGRAIGDGLSNIGSFASDIGRKIVDTIRGGINRVIDSINSGIADIDNFLPGSLPRLPRLAKGGIIDSPTLAILGEGNRREVVIPLEDPARAQELAVQSGLAKILTGLPSFNGGTRGGDGVSIGDINVTVTFVNAIPTRAEARAAGEAVGEGVAERLAQRNVGLRTRSL
jgi:hypothetical protein